MKNMSNFFFAKNFVLTFEMVLNLELLNHAKRISLARKKLGKLFK